MDARTPSKVGAVAAFSAFAVLLTATFFTPAEIGGQGGDIIETIAGSFPHRTLALEADLPGPPAAAADRSGNIYISTFEGSTVLKLTPSGQVIPFAGNGLFGFGGDGGPATSATLASPDGVVVNSAGDVFICDPFNNRIRRVDARTAIITTVAGNGSAVFSGDGGPAIGAQYRRKEPLHHHGGAVRRAGHEHTFDAHAAAQHFRRCDAHIEGC